MKHKTLTYQAISPHSNSSDNLSYHDPIPPPILFVSNHQHCVHAFLCVSDDLCFYNGPDYAIDYVSDDVDDDDGELNYCDVLLLHSHQYQFHEHQLSTTHVLSMLVLKLRMMMWWLVLLELDLLENLVMMILLMMTRHRYE